MFLFIIIWISYINKLLNFLFINSKLQVDCHNALICSQMHSTPQILEFTVQHMSSRFYTTIPLLSQRNVYWFWFYFPFFEYFHLIFVFLLIIQDLNNYPFLWLVNVQVNKPIMWKVGPSTYFGECSTLVVGPSHISSIEHPKSRLLPESFLHAEAQ